MPNEEIVTQFTHEQIRNYYETRLKREFQPNYHGEVQLPCPLHNDSNPSFSLNLDKGLWNCFSACGGGGILKFEELLFGCSPKEARESIKALLGDVSFGPITKTTYIYNDESGKPTWGIDRIWNGKAKQFGAWHYETEMDDDNRTRKIQVTGKPAIPTLYHLDEVAQAGAVFLTEGEKCADALRDLLLNHGVLKGRAVTTAPFGAGNWKNEYSSYLQGKSLFIFPDNDDQGWKHAAKVAASASPFAESIKIVRVPGEKGSDIADFILAGNGISEWLEIVEAAELAKDVDFASEQAKWKSFKDTTGDLTDTGNGNWFVNLFGDQVRYDHLNKNWLIWADHWWKADLDGEIDRLIRKSIDQHQRHAETLENKEHQKKLWAWCQKSRSRDRQNAAKQIISTMVPIATHTGHGWNEDPWLLAVGNGIVDLHIGQLRAGKPEDKITIHTDTIFDPNAACPKWEQFLKEIFKGDSELISYIARAVGYSITGLTNEQVFFVQYGEGSNGKSLFDEVLEVVLGGYAYTCNDGTFEYQKNDKPFSLIKLQGKRFVKCSEVNKKARFNEQRIKTVAGGGTLTDRTLYSDFVTFTVQAKLWFAVNHKPGVADDSEGFWRRVQLIPYEQQFKIAKPGEPVPEGLLPADENLKQKLLEEKEGILAWAVRSCLQWQKEKLTPPGKVLAAIRDYREESSLLLELMREWNTRKHNYIWEGTSARLLKELMQDEFEHFRSHYDFPKNPSQLGKDLKKITPLLKEAGMQVVLKRSNGTSNITISKLDGSAEPETV